MEHTHRSGRIPWCCIQTDNRKPRSCSTFSSDAENHSGIWHSMGLYLWTMHDPRFWFLLDTNIFWHQWAGALIVWKLYLAWPLKWAQKKSSLNITLVGFRILFFYHNFVMISRFDFQDPAHEIRKLVLWFDADRKVIWDFPCSKILSHLAEIVVQLWSLQD